MSTALTRRLPCHGASAKKVEGKNVDVPITDVKLYKDNILLDGITASKKIIQIPSEKPTRTR